MLAKIGFGLFWLVFMSYAVFLSPPDQPGELELLKDAFTGKLDGINPLVITVFYILVVWDLVYSTLVFADWRGQSWIAVLCAIGSFFVGSFTFLPYLVLRKPNPTLIGKNDLLLKLLGSRVVGILLTLAAGSILFYGLRYGDWTSFYQQWKTSRLINLTSLDALSLCILFSAILGDDMKRRDWKNPQLFWLFALVPLFGPLAYLCTRPPLVESDS
jgi:hypothetical protein